MKIVGATGLGGDKLFLDQSIGIALRSRLRNLNLKSQFSIFNSFRDIRVHMYDFLKLVGGLWALKRAWHTFRQI